MNIKCLIGILFSIFFFSCKKEKINLEICFDNVHKIIGDSTIKLLMYSPLDSYNNFANIIRESVIAEAQYDSVCSNAIEKFLIKNYDNSITINNLIMYQQFQTYLKNEEFDSTKAKNLAIKYDSLGYLDTSR